jgi:PD-(D/E)XK nuclease superfamily
MHHPPNPLPLLPAELLRRHHCTEPTDTRFRAVARLRQSLWREQHGHPCGRYVDANGRPRRLGSRVSYRVGRTGVNLTDPALVPLVRREIAYRELGAVIHVDRLWTNLLTSQALTFNLFGPLKQNPPLATAVMRRLVPDLVHDVIEVRFEHSPARGHPAYTADHTAFDVLIRCTTPHGHNAFVAIEIKYSEAPAGIASPCRPRYDALSQSARVFTDPNSPALRHAPIEQFWREQLLVTAMLECGHYQHGRLLVIAPTLNAECQAAITRYRTELISDDPAETRFQATTLEDLTTAIGNAGADTIAARVIERYLDFSPVHRALAETFNTPPDAI